MIEILLIILILCAYVIPFKGIIPLSKREEQIFDAYKHSSVNLGDTELVDEEGNSDLIANDKEFGTMNVLGDLDTLNANTEKDKNVSESFTDIDLNDILK